MTLRSSANFVKLWRVFCGKFFILSLRELYGVQFVAANESIWFNAINTVGNFNSLKRTTALKSVVLYNGDPVRQFCGAHCRTIHKTVLIDKVRICVIAVKLFHRIITEIKIRLLQKWIFCFKSACKNAPVNLCANITFDQKF